MDILPAISLAATYTKIYHLESEVISVCIGVSLAIGSLLNKMCAGRASDAVMYHIAGRNGGVRIPEYRLYLSPLSAVFNTWVL